MLRARAVTRWTWLSAAAVAPNASVSVGFQATHTGDTAKPTGFALNGVPCAIA